MSEPNFVDSVREYVATRRTRLAELAAEATALQQESETLAAAPLSIDDVKQVVCDYIDRRGAMWPQMGGWGEAFERLLYPNPYSPGNNPPLSLRNVDAMDANPFNLAPVHFAATASESGQKLDSMLMFFCGDAIKARVLEYIDQAGLAYQHEDEARIGPPIVERRERLAEIASRAGEIAEEEATIKAELNEIYTAGPQTGTAHGMTPAQRLAEEQARHRDYDIYANFNGRNEAERAERYGVSAAHVRAVAARTSAPPL